MNARHDVLARVRHALRDATEAPLVPRNYRAATRPDLDILELFTERVSDYRASVVRCEASGVEVQITDALNGARAVVPADLPWSAPGVVPDTGLSARELDTFDAVVTAAAAGVAVTGTIILDHAIGQGRRALSLVPDLHVCVVRAEDIRYGVADAVAALDPKRPQTWISGPSATSDIELTRVEGVHGPRTLRVIVVGQRDHYADHRV